MAPPRFYLNSDDRGCLSILIANVIVFILTFTLAITVAAAEPGGTAASDMEKP
jgi:hypothetical protein